MHFLSFTASRHPFPPCPRAPHPHEVGGARGCSVPTRPADHGAGCSGALSSAGLQAWLGRNPPPRQCEGRAGHLPGLALTRDVLGGGVAVGWERDGAEVVQAGSKHRGCSPAGQLGPCPLGILWTSASVLTPHSEGPGPDEGTQLRALGLWLWESNSAAVPWLPTAENWGRGQPLFFFFFNENRLL